MIHPLITLTTDFGTEDAYVAQVKGQILSICPAVRLIDVTHAIPPQNVLAGALVVSHAAPFFPSGTIHLVVIDPGVGTDRRMIAAEIDVRADDASPTGRQRFVLPDNGLIGPLVDRFGLVGANVLRAAKYWRSSVSSTFHGRDIMGPVAAHWAAGVPREQFGPAAVELQRLDWPEAEIGREQVRGEILAIDHFGNAITNVPALWLQQAGARMHEVWLNDRWQSFLRTTTYGEHAHGTAVLLVGSHGRVELAVVGGSARRAFELATGMTIEIRTVEDTLSQGHPS